MADYYSFKKNNVNDTRYIPGKFGTALIWITMPACLVAILSVFIAVFTKGDTRFIALVVTGVAFVIAFVGSILMAIDVMRHNRKVKKQLPDKKETKKGGMDIGRIVHLAIGIVVGVIIAYLVFRVLG